MIGGGIRAREHAPKIEQPAAMLAT
jgi:hypothetical protein